jgi:endonuclease/exonuclease/phosphatase (EEP) superfamily protein YafD
MDAFGKMIFLKSGYAQLDTVYYNQIPDLVVTIPKGNNDILLISSQIVPPFNDSYEGSTSSEHLLSLSNYISLRGKPLLLTGQFNQVYWSQEMRIFTNVTRLENSRKSLSMLLNGVPYEHIYYSAEFECTRLDELYDESDNHIGIFGEYQLGLKTGRFTKANAL